MRAVGLPWPAQQGLPLPWRPVPSLHRWPAWARRYVAPPFHATAASLLSHPCADPAARFSPAWFCLPRALRRPAGPSSWAQPARPGAPAVARRGMPPVWRQPLCCSRAAIGPDPREIPGASAVTGIGAGAPSPPFGAGEAWGMDEGRCL